MNIKRVGTKIATEKPNLYFLFALFTSVRIRSFLALSSFCNLASFKVNYINYKSFP